MLVPPPVTMTFEPLKLLRVANTSLNPPESCIVPLLEMPPAAIIVPRPEIKPPAWLFSALLVNSTVPPLIRLILPLLELSAPLKTSRCVPEARTSPVLLLERFALMRPSPMSSFWLRSVGAVICAVAPLS